MTDYTLFSPIKINGIQLPNRIVMAPMASNFADDVGGVTQQLLAYYRKRVQGRPGMIISESCYVSPEGRGAVKRLGLARDDVITGHRIFTDMVHDGNVHVCAQLHHAGATAPMQVIGQYPVSCSSTPLISKGEPFVGVIPKTLTKPEIQKIINRFGKAAVRARKAGYDGVQIHAAHGYLINQFLSPHTNVRDDDYGGSETKRMKFLLEIVREVRRKVPAGYPVLCRMSGAEFHDGGYNVEFIARLAKRLENEGVDEISISAGNYNRLDLISPIHPKPPACYTKLSTEIKKGLNIPVGVVGRLNTPEVAEEVLTSGKADLIYLGRELIADPLWPAKAHWPDLGPIRPCIFCNRGCFDRMMVGDEIRCAVNPMVGRESASLDQNVPDGKRLLVVGGGPAGMQAAVLGAGYGYEVHLIEKSKNLGGKLHVAAIPEGKQGLKSYCDYLIQRINELGVHVQTATSFAPRMIDEIAPDKVIIATGAEACGPEVAGLSADETVSAEAVLEGCSLPGRHVVVIGGGLVGIETALHLSKCGKQVAVVEIAEDVLNDMGAVLKRNMLSQVGAQGIQIYVNTKIIETGDRHVTISNVAGETEIPADHLVIAVGYRSNPPEHLKDMDDSIPSMVLGDAFRPGMLLDITLQIQQFLLDSAFFRNGGEVSQDLGQTCTII